MYVYFSETVFSMSFSYYVMYVLIILYRKNSSMYLHVLCELVYNFKNEVPLTKSIIYFKNPCIVERINSIFNIHKMLCLLPYYWSLKYEIC